MPNATSTRPGVVRRFGVPLLGAAVAAGLLTASVSAATGTPILGMTPGSLASCLQNGQVTAEQCRKHRSGQIPAEHRLRPLLHNLPAQRGAQLFRPIRVPSAALGTPVSSPLMPGQQALINSILAQVRGRH